MSDTIFALASAKGRAGISVIRLSGPDAFPNAQKLAGSEIPDRQPVLKSLRDSRGMLLDQALILGFKKPASFTGEDVIELQCHGSVAVVRSVLEALSEYPLCRLADPGEFTKRALLNGRLDLSQVEGLGDLIAAETPAQQNRALQDMEGVVSEKIKTWRAGLIRAAALIEATIDFADEDIPQDISPEVINLLNQIQQDFQKQIKGSFAAERIREGFEVAIVGAPNVGKSTLLNTLADRQVAITSEIAGTTRDVIEVRMEIAGLPVTLLDTAGLRETDDHIETIGVNLAMTRAQAADLRLFLKTPEDDMPIALTKEPDDLEVWSKSDIYGEKGTLNVSAVTGAGIDQLIAKLADILEHKSAGAEVISRERHRVALIKAQGHINEGKQILSKGYETSELAAEEMRQAIYALDSIIGRVDVEHVLDEIFSSFCLGK